MRLRSIRFLLFAFSLTAAINLSVAQVVIAKVQTGIKSNAIAVNSATNQIYVSNRCGNDSSCSSTGTVTIIDGATDNTTTVGVGYKPQAIAVNSATNKIYVTNMCGNDPTCAGPGTVTVIDGATNHTTNVGVGYQPQGIAVNPVTDQVYIANTCSGYPTCGSGSVTDLDGGTNNTTTIGAGTTPRVLAVNPVTNKIYVTNAGNMLTVIDGAANNTVPVTVGYAPDSIAINTLTDQIYVVNVCGGDPLCSMGGTVTVIDGATNNTKTVNTSPQPHAAAVNEVTNKIYVTNGGFSGGTSVTVIDGMTLSTTTVMAGSGPYAVGVNSAMNKIYVTDVGSADVTMIDGATNYTVFVSVDSTPIAEAVNTVTNRIYVASTDQTVAVIAGANAAPLQFVPVSPPCRLVDTRFVSGGTGPIEGGTSQSFNLPQAAQKVGCADLSSAAAFSLNVTVVPQEPLGYLTVWPTGEDQPNASTLNSLDGRVKANAAIIPAGYQGAISAFASNTTDLVVDIDGYFSSPGSQTLTFYALPPCRVADTRNPNLPSGLGPPYMMGGVARDFPILNSNCSIPSDAQAYSFNITAVPHVPLGYVTVWPAGQPRPGVSTLNALTGTVVANAAIVPAGVGGDIDVFPSNDTDLVIDVNGYFAAPGAGGLSLYPTAPCRVVDTRQAGNGQPFVGELTVSVEGSICAPPNTAQSYVLNATVVPSEGLGYLTLWADGQQQPGVSTLNALDGAVTSNMAIVPTTNGEIDAFATNLTQLILDLSSYFAP